MRFDQYLFENKVVEKAKEILRQKEEDQKDFEESLKRVDVKKLSSRIGFRRYSPDKRVKAVLFAGIVGYEKVLDIPSSTKYMVTLMKGSTSAGGEGQVEYRNDKIYLSLVQDVWAEGRSEYFLMLKTLAHEMIHVEQKLRGMKFRADLPYEKRPTEIDAFKRQDQVFRKFLKRSDGTFFGRDVKIENGKLLKRSRGKPTGFDFKEHFPILSKEVPDLTLGDIDELEYEQVWKPL
jgi:hypothetical protein